MPIALNHRRVTRRAALPMLSLLTCLLGLRTAGESVKIQFVVTVPQSTPADATVFVAGNIPELGGVWKPDGLALTRNADGTWGRSLSLPRGETLEFKFTCGSWDSVEKAADNAEIANRTLALDRDQKVELKVESWAGGGAAAPRVSTLSGNIKFHDDFESRILKNKRRIGVYLPPQYDDHPDQRYPVLYMQDGQNCFDDATSFAGEWHADETAGRLIAQGKIVPLIIVAVANAGANRTDEYTPSKSDRYDEGGDAQKYARFLLTEVKPFIDQHYRTKPGRESTGVCGSSLGGLVSLYIAMKNPDRVGLCGAVSPSLWWGKDEVLKAIETDPSFAHNCRIWVDMGTAENVARTDLKDVENARHLAAILEKSGLRRGKDFQYLEVDGGQHNEAAWAKRFDRVLMFLFGT